MGERPKDEVLERLLALRDAVLETLGTSDPRGAREVITALQADNAKLRRRLAGAVEGIEGV